MIRLIGRLRRSLPARLIMLFIFMGFGALMIVTTLFSLGLRDQWRSTLRPHLVQYLDYVREDIGVPPNIDNARALAASLPINIYIQGPEVDFSSTERRLNVSNIEFKDRPHRGRRHGSLAVAGDQVAIGERDDTTVLRIKSGAYRLYFELDNRNRPERRQSAFWIAMVVLGALIWFCYYLIRRLLRPVQDIQSGVHLMALGQLDHRIEKRRHDDLGNLVDSINTMAGEIQNMLDAKRQLLLAMSHELRSPLTRARVTAALLDASRHRDRLGEDLKEMETMINELLESEKLNSRHAALQRSATDVVTLTRDVIDDYFAGQVTLAPSTGIDTMNIDAARTQLLLRNLIGNAVRHGGDADTPPAVELTREGDWLHISVTDYGPGIAESHIDKISEPFYRVDEARSRDSGGVGLGLYLCRLIAEAHGGALTIESEIEKHTRVSVSMRVN